MSNPPVQPTGVFEKDMLELLNGLTQRMQDLQAQRSSLLAAYAAGAGLGKGTFNWHARTGTWTFTPDAVPAPNGAHA